MYLVQFNGRYFSYNYLLMVNTKTIKIETVRYLFT